MPARFRIQTALAGLLLLPIACGGAETGVRRVALAPEVEARPADCEVVTHSSRPAPVGTRALAELSVHCRQQTDDRTTRTLCREALRRAACETGADIAWSYHFAREVGGLRLDAKVGLKPEPLAGLEACVPTCSPGRRCEAGYCIEVCDPVCEDGFVCEGGSCEPICRPRCEEDEVCTAERVCGAPPEDAGVTDGATGDGAAGDGGVAQAETAEAEAAAAEPSADAGAGVATAAATAGAPAG
jgi:hypothetical protein